MPPHVPTEFWPPEAVPTTDRTSEGGGGVTQGGGHRPAPPQSRFGFDLHFGAADGGNVGKGRPHFFVTHDLLWGRTSLGKESHIHLDEHQIIGWTHSFFVCRHRGKYLLNPITT